MHSNGAEWLVSGNQVCHTVTGHAATTVMRIGNQWREEGHTHRRAGTGPLNVTTARDDRILVRTAVTYHTASSIVFSRRWSTATGLDLSASTVRRCLLRAGLVARMPLHRLPFPETTNASDWNGHMNVVTGVLSAGPGGSRRRGMA